jgi:isoquinoline 1-oxidoreductase subunit alpha
MTTVTLNGRPTTVDADPTTPTFWAVRNNVARTGTKFGCGMARPGACAAHLDGGPIRSCVTPLAAAGRQLSTIEAMARRPGGQTPCRAPGSRTCGLGQGHHRFR